jgi:hypothetical protein
MTSFRSAVLTGLEFKALLAADMVCRSVPFVHTARPTFTVEEDAAMNATLQRVYAARSTLVDSRDKPWSAQDHQASLSRTASVEFDFKGARLFILMLEAALAEFSTDAAIHPYAPPTVRVDLIGVLAKLRSLHW